MALVPCSLIANTHTMSNAPTLEKVSSNKVFEGDLVKYKFKVRTIDRSTSQRGVLISSEL